MWIFVFAKCLGFGRSLFYDYEEEELGIHFEWLIQVNPSGANSVMAEALGQG